ncbi:hypothetical protein ACJJTC_019303 [Scirpophaga incertulas]
MSKEYYNETSCECLAIQPRFNRGSKTIKRSKRFLPKKSGTSKFCLTSSEIDNSCSAGTFGYNNKCNHNRRHTKSDLIFSSQISKNLPLDCCKNCGDNLGVDQKQGSKVQKSYVEESTSEEIVKSTYAKLNTAGKKLIKPRTDYAKNKPNDIKQYYKNKNFKSADSIGPEKDFKKLNLGTITEMPEVQTAVQTGINIREVSTDSEEEISYFDTNDVKNISNMKKFREENYFECHSAKSRVDSKASIPCLGDHECSYRFYLNDRLFPVPLNSDHNNNVRCVECQLPMDLKHDQDVTKPNGAIQAKVRINGEAQDMLLMLPVRDSLIIKEKRKELKQEEETLYFGVIKLDSYGNSIFNSTLPSDSLALKYQKGYREIRSDVNDYRYEGVDDCDVITV